MRNANRFRRYATATGLLLIFLLVGLWASGRLAEEVRAEAEPGVSTTADEFPFLTIPQYSALPPATALRDGFLPSWPVSSEDFILWPWYLHASRPVSRAPPVCSALPVHLIQRDV
jgi:hypothetical protein